MGRRLEVGGAAQGLPGDGGGSGGEGPRRLMGWWYAGHQGPRASCTLIHLLTLNLMPQGPEVEYCLNAIPMGGYVAFPDDELAALALEREEKDRRDKQGDKKDGKEGGSALAAEGAAEGAGAAEKAAPSTPALDPSDPNLLKNRPIPQRALVISAGVLANLAFAYLVLLAQVGRVGRVGRGARRVGGVECRKSVGGAGRWPLEPQAARGCGAAPPRHCTPAALWGTRGRLRVRGLGLRLAIAPFVNSLSSLPQPLRPNIAPLWLHYWQHS